VWRAGGVQVGRYVNQTVAARFGKTILELGGNNAMIVDASANLDLAVRATLFGYGTDSASRLRSLRSTAYHRPFGNWRMCGDGVPS
jgi:aldehyde dehydrogenase (NAD+)